MLPAAFSLFLKARELQSQKQWNTPENQGYSGVGRQAKIAPWRGTNGYRGKSALIMTSRAADVVGNMSVIGLVVRAVLPTANRKLS
ncbi:hypothetical protein OKW11_001213 [Pseudomonas baetica]|nr:hypothetical protein [Pseudomonas baetica]